MDENTMQEDMKREKRIMWAKRICWTLAILMYLFGLYLIAINVDGFYGNWYAIPGMFLDAASGILISIMAFTVRYNEPVPNDKYTRRIIYRKVWLTNAVLGVACGLYIAFFHIIRILLNIYYVPVLIGLNFVIRIRTKDLQIDHRLLWIVNALINVPCLLTAFFVSLEIPG